MMVAEQSFARIPITLSRGRRRPKARVLEPTRSSTSDQGAVASTPTMSTRTMTSRTWHRLTRRCGRFSALETSASAATTSRNRSARVRSPPPRRSRGALAEAHARARTEHDDRPQQSVVTRRTTERVERAGPETIPDRSRHSFDERDQHHRQHDGDECARRERPSDDGKPLRNSGAGTDVRENPERRERAMCAFPLVNGFAGMFGRGRSRIEGEEARRRRRSTRRRLTQRRRRATTSDRHAADLAPRARRVIEVTSASCRRHMAESWRSSPSG